MTSKEILLKKIAALQKSFESIDYGSNRRALGAHVNALFDKYYSLAGQLRVADPDLFGDLDKPAYPEPLNVGVPSAAQLYKQDEITPLVQSITYILNLSKDVCNMVIEKPRTNRVFITHGRSQEWRKVQEYLEKTLGILTLELSQEPFRGRVILQKLSDESEKCNVAVIVMTGDDVHGEEVRARENVIHEIGFFQGKYGIERTILMHEKGANIPTNIDGLGYVSFESGQVSSGFGELLKELNAIIPIINGKIEY